MANPYGSPAITIKNSRDPWSVYGRVQGELNRVSAAPIRQQAQASKANVAQGLTSRGLFNTTVFDNLTQGIDRAAAQDISQLRGRTSLSAMGMVGTMTPPLPLEPGYARMLGYTAGMGGQGNPDWLQRLLASSGAQRINVNPYS